MTKDRPLDVRLIDQLSRLSDVERDRGDRLRDEAVDLRRECLDRGLKIKSLREELAAVQRAATEAGREAGQLRERLERSTDTVVELTPLVIELADSVGVGYVPATLRARAYMVAAKLRAPAPQVAATLKETATPQADGAAA